MFRLTYYSFMDLCKMCRNYLRIGNELFFIFENLYKKAMVLEMWSLKEIFNEISEMFFNQNLFEINLSTHAY